MGIIKLPISKGLETIIDESDYLMLKESNMMKWCAQKNGKRFYVSKTINRSGKIYLHRYIMNPGDGLCVDHINGDSLDNRRSNLRICSYRENARNVKKNRFKGIAKTKSGRFTAQIEVNGVHMNLGTFTKDVDAARAYDIAAALCFGEFASFNFPFSRSFIKLKNK